MNLYTCYTPSHRELFDQHFCPSLHQSKAGEAFHHYQARELPQRSATGAYESTGFQTTCMDKVLFIRELVGWAPEPFLFSDVDVRFYGPIVDDLSKLLDDADMAFQWDGPRGRECSGFMVLRPSPGVEQFWREVYTYMKATGAMDQDALHAMLKLRGSGFKTVILPERYWTYGRLDKIWNPGDPVDPPADLLMHHANWTVGTGNKMALLQTVKEHMENPRKVSGSDEAEDLSPVIAAIQARAQVAAPILAPKSHERLFTVDDVHRLIETERNKLAISHNPMPLALVLQFWKGDKHEACELARLLADCEPVKRTDVGFVFARQENCPFDAELYETQLYVGAKFPVSDLKVDGPEGMKYPGVCAQAWASAAKQLADAYLDGRLPYHSAFFFEADGGPLPPLRCWIDRIKDAHQETLSFGKMFTGVRMRETDHLNGTLVMALRAIIDIPSLSRCPSDAAWDIFHGQVLVRESHPTNIIRNDYGLSLTDYGYHHFGREAAWITSVKDETHHHWARQILAKEKKR
jgi:hypothetical protein